MPRLMMWLTLIVVLSGSPLRLAEAASDQARTLVEDDGGAGIDEVDGGVGDEPGETIKADIDPASTPMAVGEILPTSLWSALSTPIFLDGRITRDPARCLTGSTQLHVLLQCFRC